MSTLPSVQRPIGIFDSGLGGLTVARAIRDRLPEESLVYLGDTARVPYGTRSAATVERYALSCARRLLQHDVKMIVVACNTASAVALDALHAALSIPVLGVIEPGARAGARASSSGTIGVLATTGTVQSGAYERAIHAVIPGANVVSHAAPLLVPLAEEGWLDGDVPRLVVARYLEALAQTSHAREVQESESNVDTIVLGCTHYPILAPVISGEARRILGDGTTVVDSALATAEELGSALGKLGLRRTGGEGGLELLVTDLPSQFQAVAGRFLGESLTDRDVELIDL